MIDITQLDSDPDTTNTNSYLSDPFDALAEMGLLITIVNSKAAAPDTPSRVSGFGIDFVKIDEIGYASVAAPTKKLTLWRGMSGTAKNGLVTVDFPAAQTGCAIVVDGFTGVDPYGSAGARFVRQSAKAAGDALAQNATLLAALAALENANNAVYVAGASSTNNAALGPVAGFTQSRDTGYGTPATGIFTAYDLLGATPAAVGLTIDNAIKDAAIIAVELRVAPGYEFASYPLR